MLSRPACVLAIALGIGAPAEALAAPALQLPWPTGQQHRINSQGYTYGCGTHTGPTHYAIDFEFGAGQPVSAVAAGTAHAGTHGELGNYVWIDHGGGFVTTYAHLSSFSGGFPRAVGQGEVLGGAGETGLASGVHLHFIMRSGASGPFNGNAHLAEPMSGYTGFGQWGDCGNGQSSPLFTSRPPRPTADESFIRTPGNGAIYRIVGGAPIHVHSCAPLGGCPGVVDVPDLSGYPSTPRNGAFMRRPDGLIARIAGGHPIPLSTCAPVDGCPGTVQLDTGGFNAYANARRDVADHTFVRVANGTKFGLIARAAGGHLIGLATCAPFGGCPGYVNVDEAGFNAYANAHRNVANGTFVRVANGTKFGLIARAAGGRLLGLTSCAPLGGCTGPVNVDEAGFDAYQAAHAGILNGTIIQGLPSGLLWQIQDGFRSGLSAGTGAVAVNDATVESIPLRSCPSGQTGEFPHCQAAQGGSAGTSEPDLTFARFSGYRISPNVFRRPTSARVSYTLTEPARVTFRVQRAVQGRRVRGKCRRPSRANRGRRACVRYVALRGSLTDLGSAGANSFRLTGRLRGKALPHGVYRLEARPVDAAGNESPRAWAEFRIARRASATAAGPNGSYDWPGMKKCGSFKADYRIYVYANKRLSCAKATRVMRALWGPDSGKVSHNGGSGALGWITLTKFPGWKCHSGSGGGSCTKGRAVAGYQAG